MRVARAPRVIGRRVHGELVLVSLPSMETRVLNDLGARVWELADGRTLDQLASAIASEADADPDRVAEDVRAFVEALEADRLLTCG